ncbi:hypothetical protein Tsubulata_041213 [Turnera subulata]|uniref:Pentacotripeptide-repeat region of PRORP domain-containing protein n=1 Tax=Turnera subulata TaxID=218843 RepID=A0A9Q0GD05_9ROSI|nr:hypothetical protein Tsubulata_041213 [Turnera subulata]
MRCSMLLPKNGDLGSLVLLFERMGKRDVVSWTTVINGFSRNGIFREGIGFFRDMIVYGDGKPNEATYVGVLSSCANVEKGGAIYLGEQLHGYMIKNEAVLTVFMGTALIDFYGKVGSLCNAIKLFDHMVIEKGCTWNAMIYPLADNGREKQALDMFQKMKTEGALPDELFRSILSEFGVVPVMEHYGCVVDLLGIAGLLSEAKEFIKSMPFEPDASVLGAFLGACKIHGDIELGNEVGERLLQMQTQHSGQYMALAYINAEVER